MHRAQVAHAALTGLILIIGAVLLALGERSAGAAMLGVGVLGWAALAGMIIQDLRARTQGAADSEG